MSKSYRNTIAISDPPDTIRKKIGVMVTDPARVRREDPGHPEVCPVYSFYKVFAKDAASRVAAECRAAERGCVECKKELAAVLIEYLAPIHSRRKELERDSGRVEKVLQAGAEKARKVAAQTLLEVKRAIGLI